MPGHRVRPIFRRRRRAPATRSTSSSAGSVARSTASSTRSPSSTLSRRSCRAGTARRSTTSAAASRSATTRGRTTRASRATRTASARATRSSWSTGTKTNTHYNLVLGGETALMVKSRFVTEYDDPIYTIGLGGSGGGIQQYVYGQDEPGLLDGGIPQYSYPDMVTQTIHIGDCELLEHWMDLQVLANPASKWRVWSNRSWLEGLSSSNTIINPCQPLTPWRAAPGSTGCISGWRGR